MIRICIVLAYCLLVTGCHKPPGVVTVSCDNPKVYLIKGSNLPQSDWDTIVTREYLRGLQSPVVGDTFFMKPGDVLLINQNWDLPKDFEITLLSIPKTYRLTDLAAIQRSEVQDEQKRHGCLNSVTYNLNGQTFTAGPELRVFIPLN